MSPQRTFFEWVVLIISNYWPRFLDGISLTLQLALVGTAAGLIIGLFIGGLRSIPARKNMDILGVLQKIVNGIFSVYVEIFRGTPMMVQAILLYYGADEALGLTMAPLTAGMIVISLNTGAYMSEIVRGGIHSVPIGQTEAAKALGMSHWKTMFLVVFPQSIRNILPSIGNEFIVNIKDSSVLNVISIFELFGVAREIQGSYFRTYETYVITALVYLVLTFTFSRIIHYLEKKMDGPQNFSLSSSTSLHTFKRRHGGEGISPFSSMPK